MRLQGATAVGLALYWAAAVTWAQVAPINGRVATLLSEPLRLHPAQSFDDSSKVGFGRVVPLPKWVCARIRSFVIVRATCCLPTLMISPCAPLPCPTVNAGMYAVRGAAGLFSLLFSSD